MTGECSGACATCPNRDKCGFKTRLFIPSSLFYDVFMMFVSLWEQLLIIALEQILNLLDMQVLVKDVQTDRSARQETVSNLMKTHWLYARDFRRFDIQ